MVLLELVHSVRGTPLDDNLVHNILLQVFLTLHAKSIQNLYFTNYIHLSMLYSVTHSNLHRGRDGRACC